MRRHSGLVVALAALVAGCGGDRERPGPVAPTTPVALTAQLLAPATGSTVITSTDVSVRVQATDPVAVNLLGVGYVARRVGSGGPTVDSAVVRFPSRSDTTHLFTLRIPDSYPTNTQVDIYGIAFGSGGAARLSAPVHVVVVRCAGGICN